MEVVEEVGPGCPRLSEELAAAGRSTKTVLAAGVNSKMLGIDLLVENHH